MNRAIRTVTEKLLRKLPRNEEYYTPDDMLEVGIPDFIVERVRIELEKNLADSILPPKSDWANMKAEEVTEAWQHFLDAIHNQTRLPASFAQGVMETAAADVLEILIEPRQSLPAYLFATKDILTFEEAEERAGWVVVYSHLGRFLPKYMTKRNLDVISKDRYAAVIRQLDEKLTKNYSPLNWAQLVDPIFVLFNGEVEPELLQRFFLDKDLKKFAKRFEGEKDTIDRQKLIEIISVPVFEDDEDEDDTESTPVAAPATAETGKKTEPEPDPETPPADEAEVSDEEKNSVIPAATVAEKSAEEEIEEDKSAAETEDDSEDVPLYKSRFVLDEEAEEKDDEPAENEPEQEEEVSDDEDDLPLYARLKPDEDEEEDEPEEPKSADEKIQQVIEEETEEDEDVDAIPFWKKFADQNGEEGSKIADQVPDEEEESESRIAGIRDAVPEDNEDEFGELLHQLSDDRQRFVKELFGEDDAAYEQTLESLSEFNNWRDAGKYLTNEVFRRNTIDMYSDIAVDFTDRLHKYFIDRERK